MAKKKYKVLVGCQNDARGTRFEPGDEIETGDFSAKTIREWLALDEDKDDCQGPVLELIEE